MNEIKAKLEEILRLLATEALLADDPDDLTQIRNNAVGSLMIIERNRALQIGKPHAANPRAASEDLS